MLKSQYNATDVHKLKGTYASFTLDSTAARVGGKGGGKTAPLVRCCMPAHAGVCRETSVGGMKVQGDTPVV